MDKDYYKILGINESDSAEDIKHAYKKLARKYHPDIAGNTNEILAKFKEINEAYEVLSDKLKKSEYDRARQFYNYAKNGSDSVKQTGNTTNPSKADRSSNEQNVNDYFKNFSKNIDEWFYNRNKNSDNIKSNNVPQKGENVYTDIEISILEAISGVEKVINMVQSYQCPKCKGRKFVNGSVCTHCDGKGEFSQHKKFTVKIPAGIKNGAKIRLPQEGGKGINGGQNGDLYITVKIKENDYLTEGLNIIKTVYIQPFEAVLGTDLKINIVNNTYNIKIPANTQNGQKIRLAGCGIVQNEKVGDIIIVLEIRIPKTLSNEEILLYKKLSEISTNNVRDSIYG